MKRFTILAMLIVMVSITFAQTHMYVWKNGAKTNYVISEVDSITFGEEKGVGVFSVGENKKVAFSTGNLQHNPKRNEWRFATNQLDYIAEGNIYISTNYDGWIDLFGWSSDNPLATFGVSTSDNREDYAGIFVDWGINKINGDESNKWRTLTYEEWVYLLETRTNAEYLHGVAQINAVKGLILLPDNWLCPLGICFKHGLYVGINGYTNYAYHQTFNLEQWSEMEQAGAVFLPAADNRYSGVQVNGTEFGYYWTSSKKYSYQSYCLYFHAEELKISFYQDNHIGSSVRLVKDVVTE